MVFDRHVISSFPTMPAQADSMLTGTFSYTHMELGALAAASDDAARRAIQGRLSHDGRRGRRFSSATAGCNQASTTLSG